MHNHCFIADIQFAFDVYASGSPLDASKLGDVLRALNLNPSLEKLEKFGATKKLGMSNWIIKSAWIVIRLLGSIHFYYNFITIVDIDNFLYCVGCFVAGEKTFKFDEFLPIYSQCKKDIKDQGCYEDFLELLKLYDKAENGKMQLGELSHSLLALGKFKCSSTYF